MDVFVEANVQYFKGLDNAVGGALVVVEQF
jgi:hypothetical protein